MFRWQHVHFMDELSRYGIEFVLFNPLQFHSIDEATTKLLDVVNEGNFDLFISSICYPGLLPVEVLDSIKKKGIPSMSIRWDNLTRPFGDKELASHFDLLWLTSKETKWIYDSWKVNTIFLPYAANPYAFNADFPSKYERSVCFIGTPYGSRAKMMNILTHNRILTTLHYKPNSNKNNSSKVVNKNKNLLNAKDFDYSGNKILLDWFRYKEGWKLLQGSIINKFIKKEVIDYNNYLMQEDPIKPEELAAFYSKYVLALASTSTNHTDVLKNPLKIINLRNFEIPMSGGLEICKYNAELANYFEPDKEIVLYQTDEELVSKALYYTQKASGTEINKMKVAARKRAEQEHTWMNRFSLAFDKLGLKYE